MLIDFVVANFRSFKDEAKLSMVATKSKSKDPSLDHRNLIQRPKLPHLLKCAAVYGPNASGKSNLVEAFRFMADYAASSARLSMAGDLTDCEPFALSPETQTEPSFFEATFQLSDGIYRYGYEITRREVVAEWLFRNTSTREARLFTRQNGKIEIGPSFKEGRKLEDKTRDNALFLSVVAQFNGALANKVVDWFKSVGILSGLKDEHGAFSFQYLDSPKKDALIDFIRNLDLAIEGLHLEKSEEGKAKETALSKPLEVWTLYSKHTRYQDGKPAGVHRFVFGDAESDGSQKLFALAGPILDTLEKGDLLIVDELDARLHPLITIKIIDLFNSPKTNPNNAQFIFTTHDVNLLDKQFFRRDQIWFTEKDRFGASGLFSLADYKIRNDASYSANYMKGKYGAIPFLMDFEIQESR